MEQGKSKSLILEYQFLVRYSLEEVICYGFHRDEKHLWIKSTSYNEYRGPILNSSDCNLQGLTEEAQFVYAWSKHMVQQL